MDAITETAKYIKERANNFSPKIGVVLGSGLGDFAEDFCDIAIPYEEIPGFEKSTVSGHKGQLVFATIGGQKVVMMQGRFHYYEGYSMDTVVLPIKVMKKLGVHTVILTNAAGGIDRELKPSDLMLIEDHINMMGVNPLIGENDYTLGERFPDMGEIYNRYLIEIAIRSADKLNMRLKKGVYMANTGPSYETPAEIKMARILGADAIGMSTVPEAIVAHYCDMSVLGISCIANPAAGIDDSILSHQDVIQTTKLSKNNFKSLLIEVIKNL